HSKSEEREQEQQTHDAIHAEGRLQVSKRLPKTMLGRNQLRANDPQQRKDETQSKTREDDGNGGWQGHLEQYLLLVGTKGLLEDEIVAVDTADASNGRRKDDEERQTETNGNFRSDPKPEPQQEKRSQGNARHGIEQRQIGLGRVMKPREDHEQETQGYSR